MKAIPFILATYIATAYVYLSQQDFQGELPSLGDFCLYAGIALAWGGIGYLLLRRIPEVIGLALAIVVLSGMLGLLFQTEVSTFLLASAITISLGMASAAIGAGIRYIATYDRSQA